MDTEQIEDTASADARRQDRLVGNESDTESCSADRGFAWVVPDMKTTREFANLEYEKAARDTQQHSTLVLTAAAAAGWLLASAAGDAVKARDLAPIGKFWTKVRDVLQAIQQEERK